MIAKRIRHKGVCDHAQTPYARRKCRAAKLTAARAAAEAQREQRIAELRDMLSEATDALSMMAGDGYDRWATHWARQRDEARQGLANLGVTLPTTTRRRFGRAA